MSLLDKKTAVSVFAKTHENASTQIDVPGAVAAKIIQIGQQLIPDEALAGEGRVENCHVTVKYGVQEDSDTLRAVVSQFGPFTVTLDKTQVFVASESGNAGGTPVVIECHSSELKKLHNAVMKAMGTEADKFPYTPHITVAYVKAQEAQHFAGSDRFAGLSFTAQAVTLSFHDDDNQVKVPLGKAAFSIKVLAAGEKPKADTQNFLTDLNIQDLQVTPNSTWQYVDTPKGQAGLNLKKLHDEQDTIEIHWLTAEERGSGRAALQRTCELADKHHIRLALWAVPLAGQGSNQGFSMSRTRLEKWYKEFGFKVVDRDKRANKPYAYMVREPKAPKTAADKPLLRQLQVLRPQIAAAAQTIYDGWTQDEDDDFGGGGICDAIAQEIQSAIVSSMVVDITEGGQDGDDHAWTIAFNDTEVYGVDISPSVYERGSGYSWTKIEDVQFSPNDVDIFPVDINPAELKTAAAAAPAPQPEIPERPQPEMEDEPEKKEPRYETRKQTHGDAWMVYDNQTGDAVDSADSQQDAYNIIKALEAGLGPGAIQRTKPAVKPSLPTPTPKGWRAPKKPIVQTTNFKKWFGSSKVVDDDGAPLKVFHGTTHEVEQFDIDRANPENYYGKAFYFSSSPTDVEANYATPTGGDITSRLSQRSEQLETELNEKYFEENGYYAQGDALDAIVELANDEAHAELLGPNQGATMPVYLSIKKPVVVEKKGGTYFEINFDERTEEESGSGVDLYNAVLMCAGNYGGRGAEVWQEISETAGPEFNAWQFEEVVRGLDILEDDNGSINSGGFIGEVYQELGYDGVIMNAWEEFGGGSKYKQMEMDYDTKHYIVWNPTQIKSATGNMGKFDKKNPSITASAWSLPVEAKFGIPSNEPMYVNQVPLDKISVSRRAVELTQRDIANGAGTKTEGAIRLFFDIDHNQLLVEDGMHRLVEAYNRGEKAIDAELWSGYSDYIANVQPGDEAKLAAVKPESKQFLETMGEKVVEEVTIGDYDFFVTYNAMMGVYQIGMQRAGMDAADISQQMETQQQNRGAGSRKELKDTIQGWLNKYHMLVIGSMNPEKTMKYIRLLKAMGFSVQKQMLMGLPLAFITDGTIKTSSIKSAGRKDATTSMVVTVDPEAVPWFPERVLIRYEQGMRWRSVLTAVKSIVGDVARKRVPWSAIYIWASPYADYEDQQNGWEAGKPSGDIMYDVLHNGAYVSVGMEPVPEAEMVGVSEDTPNYDPCPSCSAPMHMHPVEASHKVTPDDDSYFSSPEIGEETNAYAEIPERVRGEYEVPPLHTLAPQLFDKSSSTYGVDPEVEAISQKYEKLGVSCFVGGSKVMPDYITLAEIVVPKDQRSEGIGTAFMEELTRYADKAGKIIVLTPDTAKGGSSVGRLQQFYGRFGFVRNKGRNKDFKTQEGMIRRPIRKTAVYGEGQNQTQHTDQTAYGITKTDPANPFAGEMAVLHEMLGKEPPVPAKPLNSEAPKGINNSQEGQGEGQGTDAQSQNVTSSLKQAGLANLGAMGLFVAEEATVPGFELYVVGAKDDPEWFELAFQQAGADASQVETQHEKLAPKTIPRQELKSVLDGWLAKYDKIHVMSYNSKYLQGYVRLLEKLGYTVDKEAELVEGKPAYYITGNDSKTDAGAPSVPQDEHGSVMASQTILAANYEEMFSGLLKLGEQTNVEIPVSLPTIKAEIDWAKATLRKSDRIVWWLRWYRLSLLEETRNRIEKQYDEVERIYNMLKPEAEGQEPKRHATEFVTQQEAEKVKQQGIVLTSIRQMVEKEEKAMGNRIGRELQGYPHISISWFVRNHSTFQHYMSLPVQKIQNVVWDKQTPDGITKDFETAEKEWQEQTKGTLVPDMTPRWKSDEAKDLETLKTKLERLKKENDDPDRIYRTEKEIAALEKTISDSKEEPEVDTVFLQFPDGWAWWKLSRAYCSEEARAMGHCGNVVGQDKPDERIISLRKPVKAGKEDRWEPHLTFILEPSGLLGEMKGKANAKPVAAYHKYIIPLLEDPRIKGIRGGGYAPERNFSMADLPKEEQDRLIAAKPALMNCEQYLARIGPDQTLIDRINGSLEWELKYSPELKGYELNTYTSLDEFIQERGNDEAKHAGKVLTGDTDLDTSYDYGEWEYAIDNLKTKEQAAVANYIRESYPDEVEAYEAENEEFDGSDHDIKQIVEEQNLEEVKEMLGRAQETGRRYGIEQQMSSYLVKAIETMEDDDDNVLHVSVNYKTYTNDSGKSSPVWDSPVTEYFAMDAACKLADSGSTWDQIAEDQYGRGNNEAVLNIEPPYNGWDEYDDEAFNEDIMEQFGTPQTPAQVAAEQKAMEVEAKKRPDLLPVRHGGKITGWSRNPAYKGPALGPGGVLWDTENNRPAATQKPAVKKRKTKKRKSHLLMKGTNA